METPIVPCDFRNSPFSWAISQPGQVLEVRGAAKWAAPAQPVPGPVTE